MTALSLLLAGAASCAAAAPPSLAVRVYDGRTPYARVMAVPDGAETSSNGRVSPAGAAALELSAKALAVPDPDHGGATVVQYQVELSGGPGVEGRLLQASGALALRPGSPVKAVQCGAWTLELDLDDGAPRVALPGFGAADGNLSVTLDLGGGSVVCRQVLKAKSRGAVVDGILSGGKKGGVVMNLAPTPAPEGVLLDYGFRHDPIGVPGFSLQRKASLALGTKASLGGYHLDLLVEGDAAP